MNNEISLTNLIGILSLKSAVDTSNRRKQYKKETLTLQHDNTPVFAGEMFELNVSPTNPSNQTKLLFAYLRLLAILPSTTEVSLQTQAH